MTALSSRICAVVGIDKINNERVYRVINGGVTSIVGAEMQYNWRFECKMLNEQQIINSLQAGLKWLNIELKDGKIKGSTGALSRFESKIHKPYVIISQLINSENKLLGYKVAGYDGSVKNIPLKEMLAYGNRITKANEIPVQNAIFVPADGEKKEHYKSYPEHPFFIEKIPSKKNNSKQKRVPIKENSKTLSKLEEIYSKEQLVQLKLGKEHGVDIRIYANPALKPNQMTVLREGLEQKINIKPIAFPEYNYFAMRYYLDCLKNRIDIRPFLNPEYNIGQLSELSLAAELGLDITKMCNPKLSPNDMAEIRERLERQIWKDELVKKDGSWR